MIEHDPHVKLLTRDGMGLLPLPRVASASQIEAFGKIDYSQPREIAVFVRHPFDRFISQWKLYGQCDLDGFAEILPTLPQREYLLQSQLFSGQPEFLGRFETLNQDWRSLQRWSGLRFKPLPKLHQSQRGWWRDYFTKQMKSKVYAILRPDFERFGYTLN